jgi:hypothetical protein
MKKISLTLIISLLGLFGCGDDAELLGKLEMTVKEVVSVNGVPYSEIEIGIFPTESLITNDYSKSGAISYKKLANGKVNFDNLLPDTYNVGIIVTEYPQPGSHKLVQIKPGQLTKVELLD